VSQDLAVQYVRLSQGSQNLQSGDLWQFDYSLSNNGDEAAPNGGVTIDITITDPTGSTTQHSDSTPGSVAAGQTVEWCWLADNGLYNAGTYTVDVHFHDQLGDYGTFTLSLPVAAAPHTGPPTTGGSTQISVAYARMSQGSQDVHTGDLWQVDYSLVNAGDKPSNPLGLDVTLLGPDGNAYGNTVGTGLGALQANQTVEWCWLADNPIYNDGTFTARLHFYDAEADYGTHDVPFTVTVASRS
jgi:hypothetical protein